MKPYAQRIARAVEPLPSDAHGKIILHVQGGRVSRVEFNQSVLTPPLDKAKGPA